MLEFPNYPEIAKKYAEALATGYVPACRYVKLAAARYLRMLRQAESGKGRYLFSPMHACDYLAFFENLPFVEDNWRNLPSAPAEPWVILTGCVVYGFRSRQTGSRFIEEVYVEIPRKSFKSGVAASVGLFDLVSGDLAPQILIAARKEEQANKVYNPVKRWAELPDLAEQFLLTTNLKKVRCRRNGGEVLKLSSMGEREDGWNPTTTILEELHAQDPSVFQVINSARGARAGQLIFSIGTAGHSPSGQGWETRKKAISILEDKAEDDQFFSLIFTLDEADYQTEDGKKDFTQVLTDDRLIAKANPMLGISLDPDVIRRQATNAMRSPVDRAEFLRTRFNIWSNAAEGLVDPEAWDRCKASVALHQFFGKKCWIGVDMAVYHDMSAIGMIFEDGDDIVVFAKLFVPEGSEVVRSPTLHGSVMSWAEAGHLTIVPGEMMDQDLIKEELKAYHEVFDVQAMAFDKSFCAKLMFELESDGFKVTEYPQNASVMTMPTDDLVARIAGQRLRHDGNPCLGWHALNATGTRKVDGTILPKKDGANSERKIDGFVALCFANGVRINPMVKPMAAQKKTVESPYATRGLIGWNESEMLNG